MTETISQEFIDFYTFGGLHGVRIIMDIKKLPIINVFIFMFEISFVIFNIN